MDVQDKPQLILIGNGGHARSCIDVIELEGRFHVAGLISDSTTDHKVPDIGAHKIIGCDSDLPNLIKQYPNALIAIGQIESSKIRSELYLTLTKIGFKMPVIVSPRAHVSSSARIGSGTIVMHGAIVNSGALVGDNCIINSRVLIEHDVKVGDHCHISTGVVVNGGAVVGAGSFVGSGTIIKQGVVIGEDVVVGMGMKVRHNLARKVKYAEINNNV